MILADSYLPSVTALCRSVYRSEELREAAVSSGGQEIARRTISAAWLRRVRCTVLQRLLFRDNCTPRTDGVHTEDVTLVCRLFASWWSLQRGGGGDQDHSQRACRLLRLLNDERLARLLLDKPDIASVVYLLLCLANSGSPTPPPSPTPIASCFQLLSAEEFSQFTACDSRIFDSCAAALDCDDWRQLRKRLDQLPGNGSHQQLSTARSASQLLRFISRRQLMDDGCVMAADPTPISGPVNPAGWTQPFWSRFCSLTDTHTDITCAAVSSKTPVSCENDSLGFKLYENQLMDDRVWRQILQVPRYRFHCWELRCLSSEYSSGGDVSAAMLARLAGGAHLTDSPPDCTPKLVDLLSFRHCWSDLRRVPAAGATPRLERHCSVNSVVSQSVLVRDCCQLLLGVPSHSFLLVQSADNSTHCRTVFTARPGLCTERVSCTALLSMVRNPLRCGNLYRQLCVFKDSRSPSTTGVKYRGGVQTALLSGIDTCMNLYRAAIVSLCCGNGHQVSLLRLCRLTRPALRVLCVLEAAVRPLISNPSVPPMLLLSHLYRLLASYSRPTDINLTAALLNRALRPYLHFLTTWVFAGCCDYTDREFPIWSAHESATECSGEYSWGRGFNGAVSGSDCDHPEFLRSISAAVFQCGSTLNVLKLCKSDHWLCGKLSGSRIDFSAAFSVAALQRIRSTIEQYECDAVRCAAPSYTDQIQQQRRAEHKLRVEAQTRASQTLATLQRAVEQHRNHKRQQVRRKQAATRAEMDRVSGEQRLHKQLQNQLQAARDKQRQLRVEVCDSRRQLKLRVDRVTRLRQLAGSFSLPQCLPDRRGDGDTCEKQLYSPALLERPQLSPVATLRRPHSLDSIASVGVDSVERCDFPRTSSSVDSLTSSETRHSLDLAAVNTESQPTIGSSFDGFGPDKHKSDTDTAPCCSQTDSTQTVATISTPSSDHQEQNVSTAVVLRRKVSRTGADRGADVPARVRVSSADTAALVADRVGDAILHRRRRVRSVHGHVSDSRVQLMIHGPVPSGNGGDQAGDSLASTGSRDSNAVRQWRSCSDISVSDSVAHTDADSRVADISATVAYQHDVFRAPVAQFDRVQWSSSATVAAGDARTGSRESAAAVVEGESVAGVLLQSLWLPLRCQQTLVNRALVTHLLTEAQLLSQLWAVRQLLMFGDGLFASLLCHQVSLLLSADRLADPVALKQALDTAVSGSMLADSPLADNVSFVLRAGADPGESGAQSEPTPLPSGSLCGLRLDYHAGWPHCIVLTAPAKRQYQRVFHVMLGLQRALSALQQLSWRDRWLEDVEDQLSRRRLHLCRHRMLFVVRALHDSIAGQLLHVGWAELLTQLERPQLTVYQLCAAHERYATSAVQRALLDEVHAPLLEAVSQLLGVVVKFHMLTMGGYSRQAGALVRTGEQFDEVCRHLYQRLNRLRARRYQPHLNDLAVRLNFSGFYTRLYAHRIAASSSC